MANQDRVNFVWAESALTTIPPIPVSEVAYRDTTQTPEQMEVGQQYDTIYNSARHNQLLFLLTSVAKTLCENGIMPFLAGQEYSQYARCIFTDGKLYTASRAILSNEQPYPTPGDDSGVWIAEETSENLVPNSRRVIAGTGLTGGGPLSSDVTLSAKLDGKTTQAAADGAITVKDVAIGGDLGDLASARGQVGPARELGSNVDYNTVTEAGFYLINSTGGVNGPIVGSASFLQVFYSKKDAFTKNLYQIVYAYSSARERMFLRQYRLASNDWSSWSEIVSSSCIGDGLTVHNGIISVPEYEGATASAAGTSGLVPPAAAGQHESFLTGGGEYKPALSTGGGVMTGSIQINDLENAIGAAPSTNTERGLFLGDKNSVIMGGFDVIQRASDNAKYTQFYSKNSSGHITSLAAVTYEDGTRELVADSPLQINDIQIKQVVDGGRRVIVLSGARGKEGYSFRFSPDTGEAYMDGRVIHAKADTAGYADTAGSAPANGGTAWAANRLRREGGVDTVWYWAGQGGQPGWLWGGNDGVNMYVYNPANFSVNYANSAGQAQLAATAVQWVVNLSGPQITVPSGGTYNVVCICFNAGGSKGAVKHYPNIAGGTVIPNAPTDYMVAGLCARVA